MDRRITTVTIARTPVSIKRFPKLCLRKKTKNSNRYVDENDIVLNPEASADNVKHSLSLSPIYKSYMSTPPFVTKQRAIVRTIPMFQIISDSDSAHNSKLSEGNNSYDKSSTSLNISHIDESIKIDDKIINDDDVDANTNILNNIEKTPTSNESSKTELTPDTVNLMDNLYGDIWRSTPGLFKKTKTITKHKINVVNINIDDNLINELNSLTINTESLPNSDENIDESLKKSPPRSIILNSLDDSDFLLSKKKVTHAVNPLSSSDSEDSDQLKPNKLDFNASYTELEDDFDNKENINEKNIKSDLINLPEKNKDVIKNKTLEKVKSKSCIVKKYGFIASLGDNIPPELRDRKATYYREHFKSKKSELTSILFKMYNNNVFESKINSSLPIVWSSTLRNTAGRAHNKLVRVKENGEKVTGRRSHIELSIKVLDTVQKLRDTLAHELCHVAVWLIDGQQRDGHGPYWKSWINKVLRRYPEIGSLPVCHSFDIHFKYSYKCTKCGYKINRHSKSIDVTLKACGYCFGKFECIYNKKTKDGAVVSTPVSQKREATGFALYVKENYGMARGGNTPHKDTMKYLGREYAKIKLKSKEN